MTDLTSSLRIALIDDVSTPAGKMAAAIKAAEVQAKELDRVMASAGSAGVSDKLLAKLKAMGASADHVKGVAKAFQDLAKAEGLAEDRSKWTVKQAQAIRNLESVTTAQVRSQLGMERALATEQARNHARRVKEFSDERRHFQAHLKGMASDIAAASGFMGGAYTGFRIGEHAVRAGAVLATEQQKFRDAGPTTTAALPEAMRVSQDVANRVPGTTTAENLRVINETRTAFGGVEEAIKNLERLQTISQAVKITTGGKVDVPAEELGQAFAKVLEMRGNAMDPTEFKRESDAMVRAIVGTSGRLTPERYLAYAQAAGRGTASNLSTRYLTEVAPTLIGDSNSPETVGTAQKGLRQIFMGHLSSKTQGQEWAKLIPGFDKSKLHLKGATPGWEVGAIPDTQLALTDPDKWIDKYILGVGENGQRLSDSAAARAHVDINDKLQVSQLLGRLAPKIGGGNQMLESLGQAASRRQILADAPQFREAHNADAIVRDHAAADAQQGVKNVNSAIEDLYATLTGDMMPAIGKGLDYLRDRIIDVKKAAEESPAVRNGLIAGGVGTAGLITFGGGKVAGHVFKRLLGQRGGSAAEVAAGGDAAAAGGFRLGGMLGSSAVAFGAGMSMGLMPDILTPRAGAQPLSADELEALKRRAEEEAKLPLWQRITGIGLGSGGISVDEDRLTRARNKGGLATGRLSVPGDQGLHFDEGSAGPAQQSWWHRIFGSASDESDKLKSSFADLATSAQSASMSLASLQSGGFGGGSGGGIINASYETGNGGSPNLSGGGFSVGSGKGAGHFFSAEQRAANIRSAALANGIDPRYAMAVARSEGFGKFSGDHNRSFGDFQMFTGGGLGNRYRRETGKDPSDPHNELDLDRYAMREAAKGGWGPWHGARRLGITGHMGMGRPRRVAPEGHPAAKAIQALNGASATPIVDTRHLERTAALIDHINDGIHRMNSGGVGARAGSYRTAMNGSFTVDGWRRSG